MPPRATAVLLATLILAAPAWSASVRSAPPAPMPAPPGAKSAPIRIGDIIGDKRDPTQAAYRKGWQLALEQLNAEGGVLGRKLQVLTREDGGKPETAAKLAEELTQREKVVALMGGASEATASAISGYAGERMVFFLATMAVGESLTWSRNNRYTYRLPASVRMRTAAVAPKALGLRKPRWAVVHADDEGGRERAATFQSMMRAFQARIEFVAVQPLPAGARALDEAVLKLADAHPDALLLDLDGAALHRFVQAGQARQLFDGRAVVALDAADPETRQALGAELPAGWLVTGYPLDLLPQPASQRFVSAYRQRFDETPGAAALLGYSALQSLATGLRLAQEADGAMLADAFSGMKVDTPIGTFAYRPLDHQSTIGVYTGWYAGGAAEPAVITINYQEGGRLQPPDHDVRRLRGESRARPKPAAAEAAKEAQPKGEDGAGAATPPSAGKPDAPAAQDPAATKAQPTAPNPAPANGSAGKAPAWTPATSPALQDWPQVAAPR
ncbi:ABC transporter substrate-binding protein [Bordetella genomosp. 1]|uniref:ABC transporter substrate-binding protein n=1 Tax=Bordetella genomosp. 1 TaxID=1395607 RepID=A0A261SHJ7_9BORD|nr:ABC transporter substrate-binding protein [Bordetella genomosp. 1]OZI36635.1 ABC transporter substrate-binding protein [Bordetella genomosp. 1]